MQHGTDKSHEAVWQDFWPKPDVRTPQMHFTGFDGNGWAVLAVLHDLGVMAVKDGTDIVLRAGERDEARAKPDAWFCKEVDDPRAIYPIRPVVHDAKYQDHPATMAAR